MAIDGDGTKKADKLPVPKVAQEDILHGSGFIGDMALLNSACGIDFRAITMADVMKVAADINPDIYDTSRVDMDNPFACEVEMALAPLGLRRTLHPRFLIFVRDREPKQPRIGIMIHRNKPTSEVPSEICVLYLDWGKDRAHHSPKSSWFRDPAELTPTAVVQAWLEFVTRPDLVAQIGEDIIADITDLLPNGGKKGV